MFKVIPKLCVTTVFGCLLSFSAHASNDYPTKPVRLIVGYSAGGSVDIVARNFAQRLSQEINQPVVVENRGGASGAVAAQYVVNSKPDGYTLYFVASPTLTITPIIQKAGFDPLSDFTAISPVVNYFNVLMVRTDAPYKTVNDLIEDARKRPNEVTYGSAGVGAANHLSGEQLADGADVRLTHVPYQGNAPAMMALISGQISFAFDVNNTAMNHIKSGKLRPLAVTASIQNPAFPDVPTLVESGYKGAEFTGWFGLVGPAGVPSTVVKKIVDATESVIDNDDFRKQMTDSGYALPVSIDDPKELRDRIERDGSHFAALIQRIGL